MAFKGPYILVSPKIGPFILLNAGVPVFPSAKEQGFFHTSWNCIYGYTLHKENCLKLQ